MVGPADPIAAGFIASLARSGGNITGLSNQSSDLAEKSLQILKDLRPGVSRVALLWNPDDPGSRLGAKIQMASGPQQGLAIESVPITARASRCRLGCARPRSTRGLAGSCDANPGPEPRDNRGVRSGASSPELHLIGADGARWFFRIICAGSCRSVASCCRFRRPHSQRWKSGRDAGRATNQI